MKIPTYKSKLTMTAASPSVEAGTAIAADKIIVKG